MIYLISLIASVLTTAWLLSGFTIGIVQLFRGRPPEWVRAVYHELRPIYLTLLVVEQLNPLVDGHPAAVAWGLAWGLVGWFVYRNIDNDDDRRRRRRRRLVEQVAQVRGSLRVVAVLVPAG